ncbi:MAG: HD domain-containing phosphohydrolase [Actinomycetota bacterium]
MSMRILFVDDEENILNGLRRTLRKAYEFDTATSGAEGLALLDQGEFAVIVSDMRMPEMGGEEFLAKAHAVQPDAVQMILSGQADLDSTVEAVNNASIFRFLTKPVAREPLGLALDAALRQYQLVHAERDLLENTLSGAVRALTEVVSLVSPAANRRTQHVTAVVNHVADAVGLADDWQLRVAAMLSGVGFAAIPTEILDRAVGGQQLNQAEQAMLDRHPDVTKQLLGPIPRLDGVSNMIRAQAGAEPVQAGLERQVAVLDLAVVAAAGLSAGHDIGTIVHRLPPGTHAADLVEALSTMAEDDRQTIADCPVVKLHPGMTLRQDVNTITGVLLASTGTELTQALLERILNFHDSTGVDEPITVASS